MTTSPFSSSSFFNNLYVHTQLRFKCSQQPYPRFRPKWLLDQPEMGKICKWIMTFFTGRNKVKHQSSVVAEKQCTWRSRAETEQKNHALAVAAAKAAAAEAAVVASQAADAVIRLMAAGNRKGEAANNKEAAAAVAIQSVFRSYLARKALRALKGVVKMQAMVRGELVRRRATATLRRIRILSTKENWTFRPVKQIVETDNGESNTNSTGSNRYLNRRQKEYKLSPHRAPRLHRDWQKTSPPPSAATTTSRRSSSWQCDDYAFASAPIHNRPRTPLVLSQDYLQYPNYLADTASSRARARSQSAPRQRPEASEWQSRRMRRPSFDTVSLASAARIQRFSSSMADTAQSCQQWSSTSPKNSECGSAWSVLTNA